MTSFETNTTKLAQSTATKHICSATNDKRLLKDMISTSELSMSLLGKLNFFANGNQHDLIARKLKTKMKAYEEQLINISEMKEGAIELKQSEVLTNFLNVGDNNTKELGTVTIVEKKSNTHVYQSQLLLRQCTIRKQKDVRIPTLDMLKMCSYMSILMNDDIILTDETNGYSIRIKQNGKASGPLNLSLYSLKTETKEAVNNLLRAASKNDGIIVVPRLSEKKILLLSTNLELKIMAEIKTLYHPKAVHVLRNGTIAVAWNNPAAFGIISVGETIVETQSHFKQDTDGRQFQSFDHMAVDEKRSHVIQPCTINRAIYGFDFEGNPKFKYMPSDNARLLSPRGVALDGDSNIYACFNDAFQQSWYSSSSSIHMLTPEGKLLQKIGTREGCPYNPIDIKFDKDGDTFAVTQEQMYTITLFKLQMSPGN